jgi:hypothetical protein
MTHAFDHITTHMVGLSAMQVHGRAYTPNADAMTTAAHITAMDKGRHSVTVRDRGNLELVRLTSKRGNLLMTEHCALRGHV